MITDLLATEDTEDDEDTEGSEVRVDWRCIRLIFSESEDLVYFSGALRPTKLKNHWLRAYCEHWTKNCRTSEPSVSSTSSVISVSKSNRPAKGAKAKDVDG